MAKKYNCPNCGAPIGYSEVCSYCGTRLNWVPFTSVKVEICPKKIVNLDAAVAVPFSAKEYLPPDEYDRMVQKALVSKLAEGIPKFMQVISEEDPALLATKTHARLLVCK